MASQTSSSNSNLSNLATYKLHANGKNFSSCKRVIILLLTFEPDSYDAGLLGVVTLTDQKCATAILKARNIILNFLDLTFIQQKFSNDRDTVTATIAHALIKVQFKNNTGIRQQADMSKIFSFRFSISSTPSENLNRSRKLLQQLSADNANMTNPVLAFRPIESPPSSCITSIQNWCFQPTENRTLTNLYSPIENEEIRLDSKSRNRNHSQLSNHTIFYSQRIFPPRFQPNYLPRPPNSFRFP